ncbi:uncharacterized protein LTR77_000504 [Saxophila tyrrhenica]|uniref:Uncharacterized protein n=1 Tax=Saxophila tyrrhenica TaxID=1690608 RepID=A0AAV9PPF2_9PEZI|nr:hypothetical protein LTR77_000504 [Saxophila tyrrhenica]
MDWTPADLHFEMEDMVEDEAESKRSFEMQDPDPLPTKLESAFESGSLVKSYEPVAGYDYHFRWTRDAERRVVKKIDRRICLLLGLMFFVLQVDRASITQSPSKDMLEDQGLSRDDWKTGQTVYFASIVAATLPSQLIGKWIGCEKWISLQMISWSIVASMQLGVTGPRSFWVNRALIGIFESGFVPSSILYVSYFYTSTELTKRLAWFWVGFPMARVACTLLASGMMQLSGLSEFPNPQGWLPGAVSAIIFPLGCIAWLCLPPSPTQTPSKSHGRRSWVSATEQKIMVNRVLRDDRGKGEMSNREPITLRSLYTCLMDYRMWPIYLIGLSWQLPMLPSVQYLTNILRTLAMSDFERRLRHLPADLIWTFNLLLFTYFSELVNERLLVSSLSQVWCLPMLISMYVLPFDRENINTWALAFLTCAQPFVHAMLLGLASRNSGSVANRAVSVAVYNMCVAACNIIALNIYKREDAPFYFAGNKILIVVAGCNIVLFLIAKRFYVSLNQRREVRWETMSRQDRQVYLATTKDRGNKRLDFRFAH